MRNLGYTCVYIFMICAYTVIGANGQADCNTFPVPDHDLCSNARVLLFGDIASTCCSSIETNDYCSAMDNGVWYSFTQSRANILTITNTGISGPIGVEIYSGTCGSLTLIDRSDCSGFNSREFILRECIQDYLIHVTSLSKGCGSFEISALEVSDCDFAETCDAISSAQELNPLSDSNQECVSSCLQYSCSSECSGHGVWFKLTTDATASTVQLAVKNSSFDPVISIKEGIDCSSTVDVISCQNNSVNEYISLDVLPSTTYFIEISLGQGTPGPFDLCVNSIQEFMDCSNGNIVPIRSMFPGEDPYGPYCPGETVTFCYDLEFHVDIPGQGNDCQWLQGLIPVLGGGWSTIVNTPETQAPPGWVWLDEGNVDYNDFSNILSLATNAEGNLILEYGAGGIAQNDLLPGGWWYTSPGSEIDCINDGDPDNMYGLEVPCGETLYFNHCFDLTTKSNNEIPGCYDNYSKDLSVRIFNLTDGETGCYNDFTCAGDTPITFDGIIDCISVMDIVADNKEICSGDFADIAVSFQEDAGYSIEIVVLDAGNTSGSRNWILERGMGKIPDQIINLGDQIETIIYEAKVYNALSNCPSPTQTFELSILPEIVLDVPTDFLICGGQATMMTAPSGFFSYRWYDIDNNLLSSAQEFAFPDAGDYILEVSDGMCQKSAGISVEVVDPFLDALSDVGAEVCNFNNGTTSPVLNLTSFQLPGINGYWYDANDNLVPDPAQINFEGVSAQVVLYSFETSNEPFPCNPQNFPFEISINDCLCPSLELIPANDVCAENQSIDLDLYKVTTEAGQWSIDGGPDVGSLDIAGSLLNTYSTTISGIYTLRFTLQNAQSIGMCQQSETIQIRITPAVELDVQSDAVACNASGAQDPDVIDLDDYLLNGVPGIWSTSSGLSIDGNNSVVFTNQPPGDYVFNYTSNNAQLPCTDVSAPVTINVMDCMCPSLDIINPGNFCKKDFEFQLNDLIIDAGPGTWSLSSGNTNDLPEIVNNTSLVFTASTATGNYVLTYTLDDLNVPSHCEDHIDLPFSVSAAPYAIIPGEVITCNEGNGTTPQILNLTPLVTGGSGGGIWSTTATEFTIINNTINFNEVPAGFYEITYTTNDAVFPCAEASVSMVVEVEDCRCPQVNFVQFPDLCVGQDTFDLNDYIDTNADGEWYINGIVGTNAIAIINRHYLRYSTFAEPGLYTLSYRLYNFGYPDDCELEFFMDFYIHPVPEAVIQPAARVCNYDAGIGPHEINFDTIFVSGSPGDWSSPHSEIIFQADNQVSFEGLEEGIYTFYYTTNDAQLPCVNVMYEMNVIVDDCTCPELSVINPGPLCQTDSRIYLYDYVINSTGWFGTWTVTGPDGIPMFVEQLDPEDMEPGDYELLFTWAQKPHGTCPDFASNILTINAKPEAEVVSEVSVCNVPNAQPSSCIDLTSMVSGDPGIWTAPANYLLDFTDLTKICFDGLPIGELYEFTYSTSIAQFPCNDVEGFTVVTIEDCSCPILDIIDPTPICNSNGSLDLQALESIDIDDGYWEVIDGPQSVVLNGDTLEASGILSGNYTLQYSPTDVPGGHCQQSSQVQLQVVESSGAVIQPSARVCNYDAGIGPDGIDFDTIFISGSPGEWSSPHSEITFQVDNYVSFEGLNEGVYTFFYTTTDAQLPCENEMYELEVIVDDCTCPELSVANPGPLCKTDSRIDLNDYVDNSTGWPGIWTVTGSDGIPMFIEQLDPEDLDPGDYEILFTWTQKPHGNCLDFANNILTIYAEPEIEVVSEVSVCNELNAQAPACIDLTSLVNGDLGIWTAPANFSGDFSDLTNICFEGLPIGELYEFTYTTTIAQLPCNDVEGFTVVTVEDCSCPILNIIDPAPICNLNGSLDLQSLETDNISDGYWEVIDGPQSIVLNGDSFDANSILSGIYTLQYSPDDIPESHCQQNSQVGLEVIESLGAGEGQIVEYCFDEMDILDLTQLLTDSDPGGEWKEITIDNPPSNSFDEINGALNGVNLTPGKYDFQYYQDNEQPCEDKFTTVSIIINRLPEADAGEPVELNCARIESLIGGLNTSMGNEFSYNWYSMQGYTLEENNAPIIMVDAAGMYVLEVMNMTTGCMVQDSVEVNIVEDQPSFDIDVISSPCDFNELGTILAINPIGGDGSYQYSIDSGTTWSMNNSFGDLSDGEYNVMIQDGRGCQNEISSIVINQSEPIGLYAGEDMLLDYSEDLITIDISTQTDLSNIDSVIWTVDGIIFCEGSVADCYSIEVNPGLINNYCVTLIDHNGCEETDCLVIEEELNVDVYINNIFSMNDITINNRLFVQSGPYVDKVLEFKVYDRWGSLMFDGEPDHSPNDSEFGWDGRVNYEDVEPGVYVYVIRVLDVLEREYLYKGDVTLIK